MIEVKLAGIGTLINKLERFTHGLKESYRAANNEIADMILDTEGLRKYPPETAANRPPEPYYIRGRGTQYKSGNDGKSEQYGTRWTKTETDYYSLAIGNTASYAIYLTDKKKQARRMALIGWRKITDVQREKWKDAAKIYWKHIWHAKKNSGLE
jgi:hypothetical protein